MKFLVDVQNKHKNGVYQIVNTVSGCTYIGSTADKLGFWARWKNHRMNLRRHKHCNNRLQRSFIQYGEEVFEFSIVVICEKSECLVHEQIQLDRLFATQPREQIFNTCQRAGNTLGRKHSLETRQKIGKRYYPPNPNKGKKLNLTIEERRQYSLRQKNSELCRNHIKEVNANKRRKIRGTHLITNQIIEFESIANNPGFGESSLIACCKGRKESYKGYRWEYLT